MNQRQWRWRSALAVLVLLCLGAATLAGALRSRLQEPAAAEPFAQLVAELSEAGGYFDTDNLISNEKSYLQVIPVLEQNRTGGGVYIGVGPDQNFSYIARLRPAVAFIIDIRRDNLLLHLLFKALFAASRNRAEYLCLLTGRPVPPEVDDWRDASIERIVRYVEATPAAAGPPPSLRLPAVLRSFGVPLSSKDVATLAAFHQRFIQAGLSLQFQTHGRPVQRYNPTYRELLLETDPAGRQRSYLASEEDFQFLRSLQQRDGIIPVVGDLAGPHALAAIGGWMRRRKEPLAAFYVSNVEDYLFRDGKFSRYVRNLSALPHNDRSVLIRSIFGRLATPRALPGYYTASVAQPLAQFLAAYSAGEYLSYYDLLQTPAWPEPIRPARPAPAAR
ncbi:MAG TPA: hypothetical protein VNN17_05710 [Terriglobia bacterium]|nr:hypothetical protein [Terriglobia bacterium]